jgi:hypothetical protein
LAHNSSPPTAYNCRKTNRLLGLLSNAAISVCSGEMVSRLMGMHIKIRYAALPIVAAALATRIHFSEKSLISTTDLIN